MESLLRSRNRQQDSSQSVGIFLEKKLIQQLQRPEKMHLALCIRFQLNALQLYFLIFYKHNRS